MSQWVTRSWISQVLLIDSFLFGEIDFWINMLRGIHTTKMKRDGFKWDAFRNLIHTNSPRI